MKRGPVDLLPGVVRYERDLARTAKVEHGEVPDSFVRQRAAKYRLTTAAYEKIIYGETGDDRTGALKRPGPAERHLLEAHLKDKFVRLPSSPFRGVSFT